MRLSSSILLLAAASIAAAAPSIKPLSSPIPSPVAAPAHTPAASQPDKQQTPPPITKPVCSSKATKQCCVSVESVTKELTTPLSDLVPWVSGVKIGSVIGIGCQPMAPDAPDYTCRNTISCCSGETLLGPGTLTTGCYDLPSQ